MAEPTHLLTVGHSHHSLDHLLDLLEVHRVQAVADVRSWPRSRHAPHFDAEPLKAALAARNIKYVFLGRELGGRPKDGGLYDEAGHVRYDRVAATPAFDRGMKRLLDGARQMRVAVMCAEENPEDCHRRLLVARVAMKDGAAISHIRGDGRLESELGFAVAVADRLFDEPQETPWRSTRSVLRGRAQNASSVA
jgi:uncharacterized protein (DUF488 family)